MAEPLIIVDSDSKGKVFLDFFKQQAEITVVSSPPFQLSHSCFVNEEKNRHDLTFSLTPLPSHKQLVKQLSEKSERQIFIALDNDQPSEYISWLISSYLLDDQGYTGSVKRLDVTGFGHEDIAKAISVASSSHPESAREFYVRILFNSTLARHLQRLVGFNKGPGGKALNYATLTAIFLLVDREVEIKMFTSRKKWQILATFGLADKTMTAHLECDPDLAPEGFVKDFAKGKELVNRFEGKKFTVDKVEQSELRIPSPSPYTLAELCHDTIAFHGIGPGKTLAVLKKLYNGILIDGVLTGLISSFTFVENDFDPWRETIRSCVIDLYGGEALQPEGEDFSGNHILPLNPKICVADVTQLLGQESGDVYELIRGRAMASQMKDAVGSSIRVKIKDAETIFQGHINSITEFGFLQAHLGRNDPELMKPAPLGQLQEGQVLEFLGAKPAETVGNVAEHYTSETLFADLSEFSIPVDPSSMAMLQGLIDHDYAKIVKDGYLLCGSSANSVTSFINRAFPKMIGVNLSAYIEQTVTEVLSGRKGLDFALKQFDQTLMIQGKILVKAKVANKIINRKRRSSSRIIKHVVKQPLPVEKVKGLEPGELVEDKSERAKMHDAKVETVAPELEGNITDETGEVLPGESNIPEIKDVNESHDAKKFLEAQNPVAEEVAPDNGLNEVEESHDTEEESRNAEDLANTQNSSFAETEPDDSFDAANEAVSVEKVSDKVEQETPQVDINESSEEVKQITTDKHKECQNCGRPMILKEDQFGKFWDCSGFPACRHSESYKTKEDSVLSCPLCTEGKLLTKRTATGKIFYVCLDDLCEFMSWSRPHHLSCLVCDSPYLVEKKSPHGRLHLRCPRAGCNYMRPMPGDDGGELVQEQKDLDASGKSKKRRLVRRVKRKGTGVASGGKKKVRVVRRRK